MKKTIYVIWGLFFFASCTQNSDLIYEESNHKVSEHFIPLTKALAYADEFMQEIQETPGTRGVTRKVKNVEYIKNNNLTRSADNEQHLYYVVNYENGGFAILSADDRLERVYAISENGSFNMSDTTENKAMAAFVNALPKQIPDDPNIIDIPIVGPPTRRIEVLVSPLIPLVIRNWNQLKFNDYVRYKCNGSEDTPVGCVVLSTCQIMSFFQYPSSYSYTNDNQTEYYNIDWNAVYNGGNREQVCRLQEVLGRPGLYDITYKLSGSSGYLDDCDKVMPKFGYYNVVASGFDTETARTELYYERKPLLVEGHYYIYTNEGLPIHHGHAWVIDGLARIAPATPSVTEDITYYFHFVWGNWRGGDGYYHYDTAKRAFEKDAAYVTGTDGGSIGHEHGNVSIYYGFRHY